MKSPFKAESFFSTQTSETPGRRAEREPLPVQEKDPRSLAHVQVGGQFETVHASAGSADWLTDGDSYNGDQAVIGPGFYKWLVRGVGVVLIALSFAAITYVVAGSTFGIGAALLWGAGFLP